MAKEQPVWKSALGWVLYALAVFLLVIQETYHWFTFPTIADKRMWILVIFLVMSAGITNILGTSGVWPWIKGTLICFFCLLLVILLLNGGGLLYDSTMGTDLYQGQYLIVLDSMADTVTAWGAIANLILACIPIAIIIITIIFITMSEHAKEYAESIISGALCIAFYIGVAYFMNLTLGINIFMPF
jgi:hypothetical protein